MMMMFMISLSMKMMMMMFITMKMGQMAGNLEKREKTSLLPSLEAA